MTYDNHLDAKKGDTRQTCRPLLHHRNKEAEGIRQTSRAVTSPAQYEPGIKLHMSVVETLPKPYKQEEKGHTANLQGSHKTLATRKDEGREYMTNL